jgi:hypothetical protein
MSAARTMPSLGAGLLAALLLSACGAASLALLTPFVGHAAALRAVVAALGLAYVLYAIGRSGERVGRITTVVCWIASAAAAALFDLPLAGYLLVHLALLWLVRSLYYYQGVLPALADLGVTLLGAAFAVWAAMRAESVWLALWCFFLVQAFHVLIPPSLTSQKAAHGAPDDAFARAHRAAESAVRRMSSAAR